MKGTGEADVVVGHGPGPTDDGGRLTVVWDARIPRFLRRLGLGESVSGRVDAVVVDRRGCETTPRVPGELVLGGRRTVVVPDRSDGAPPVEVRVRGRRGRYGQVVRTLRRTVALDAMIDEAFERARGQQRLPGEDDDRPRTGVPTDGGSPDSTGEAAADVRDTVESAAARLADVDASLAVGGFAAAVDPLR